MYSWFPQQAVCQPNGGINPTILLQELRMFHRFDMKIIRGMWIRPLDLANRIVSTTFPR